MELKKKIAVGLMVVLMVAGLPAAVLPASPAWGCDGVNGGVEDKECERAGSEGYYWVAFGRTWSAESGWVYAGPYQRGVPKPGERIGPEEVHPDGTVSELRCVFLYYLVGPDGTVYVVEDCFVVLYDLVTGRQLTSKKERVLRRAEPGVDPGTQN